jgi:hypothetical protein
MSEGGRMVHMTESQYQEVERCLEDLMRGNKNERAAEMMRLALAYKFAEPAAPELPLNVVEIDRWSRKVGA